MSTEVLSIRVPAELKQRYDQLAADTGRPTTYYVLEALEQSIDDLAWAYNIAALAEDIRAGKVETLSLDETCRELGLNPAELRADAAHVVWDE